MSGAITISNFPNLHNFSEKIPFPFSKCPMSTHAKEPRNNSIIQKSSWSQLISNSLNDKIGLKTIADIKWSKPIDFRA